MSPPPPARVPPPPPLRASPAACPGPIAGRWGRPDDLAALEGLRDHPRPRVQNAVGDQLACVARHRPEMVAALCRRWLAESPSPATRRIVRRALGRGPGAFPPPADARIVGDG